MCLWDEFGNFTFLPRHLFFLLHLTASLPDLLRAMAGMIRLNSARILMDVDLLCALCNGGWYDSAYFGSNSRFRNRAHISCPCSP